MTILSDFKSVVSSNLFSILSGSILSHRRTAELCSLTQIAGVLVLMGRTLTVWHASHILLEIVRCSTSYERAFREV